MDVLKKKKFKPLAKLVNQLKRENSQIFQRKFLKSDYAKKIIETKQPYKKRPNKRYKQKKPFEIIVKQKSQKTRFGSKKSLIKKMPKEKIVDTEVKTKPVTVKVNENQKLKEKKIIKRFSVINRKNLHKSKSMLKQTKNTANKPNVDTKVRKKKIKDNSKFRVHTVGKFRRHTEYCDVVYINFESPPVSLDQISTSSSSLMNIPRTLSEYYMQNRRAYDKLLDKKEQLLKFLQNLPGNQRLTDYVGEPLLNSILFNAFKLDRKAILDIINFNTDHVSNIKIDRMKMMGKSHKKFKHGDYRKYLEQIGYSEMSSFYPDYLDCKEIYKFRFLMTQQDVRDEPIKKLFKLAEEKTKYTKKKIRFKNLKNIKESIKDRNEELNKIIRNNKNILDLCKGRHKLSDKYIYAIFNSYVPIELIYDNMPIFTCNQRDLQYEKYRYEDDVDYLFKVKHYPNWDISMDLLNMDFDVIGIKKYHKRDLLIEKYHRLRLNKPKFIKLPLEQQTPPKIKVRKFFSDIDSNFTFNFRVYSFTSNSYKFPHIDYRFKIIYERDARLVENTDQIKSLKTSKKLYMSNDVFLNPIKRLEYYLEKIKELDIDENYFEITDKKRKMKVRWQYLNQLFKSLYPDRFPKIENPRFYIEDLNPPLESVSMQNILDRRPERLHGTDFAGVLMEPSSEIIVTQRRIKPTRRYFLMLEVKKKLENRMVDLLGDFLKSDSDSVVDENQQTKMFERFRELYASAKGDEGSLSDDDSTIIFDQLHSEHSRMMKAFYTLKFNVGVQTETPKCIRDETTEANPEFQKICKHYNELNCSRLVRNYQQEYVDRVLKLEEEENYEKYMYYICAETPLTWDIEPMPESLEIWMKRHEVVQALRRICFLNTDRKIYNVYFNEGFQRKGIQKAMINLWRVPVYGTLHWPIFKLKWHPEFPYLLFTLLSEAEELSYDSSTEESGSEKSFDQTIKNLKSRKEREGKMSIIDLKYRLKPIKEFKFSNLPSTIEFHPTQPNYFLIGLKNGEINFYNFALETQKRYKPILVGLNKLLRQQYLKLNFIQDRLFPEDEMMFYSVSSCGHIDKWTIYRTHLDVIPHMRFKHKLGSHLDFSIAELPLSITCVGFNPPERRIFLAGTMSGDIIKGNLNNINEDSFQKIQAHIGAVTFIRYNELIPKVVITCDVQFYIKCWDVLDMSLMTIIQAEEPITQMVWAPFSSTAFFISQGKALFMYDLFDNIFKPVIKQNLFKQQSSVKFITTFCFHSKYDNIVAVGCDNGYICLVKISPNIRGYAAPSGSIDDTVYGTIDWQNYKIGKVLYGHRSDILHSSETESTTDSELFYKYMNKEKDEGDSDEDAKAAPPPKEEGDVIEGDVQGDIDGEEIADGTPKDDAIE